MRHGEMRNCVFLKRVVINPGIDGFQKAEEQSFASWVDLSFVSSPSGPSVRMVAMHRNCVHVTSKL